MKRVAIVVEGETEEEFVKQLLSPHLAKLSWDFKAVTTLVDFYGFGRRQPGETVEELEARIDLTTGNHSRREPHQVPQFAYVQQYEFEALLFSDPNSFSVLPNLPRSVLTMLSDIAGGFPTPEDINDSPTTAPSKRIEQCVADYKKRFHGPAIALKIGLPRIRAACPRFNDWIGRLEDL